MRPRGLGRAQTRAQVVRVLDPIEDQNHGLGQRGDVLDQSALVEHPRAYDLGTHALMALPGYLAVEAGTIDTLDGNRVALGALDQPPHALIASAAIDEEATNPLRATRERGLDRMDAGTPRH